MVTQVLLENAEGASMGTHVTSADLMYSQSGTVPQSREAHSSGVSWGAVIGGAFVAAALYLILLALGAGFGLSAVSPWSDVGLNASTAGALAICPGPSAPQ